jgi:hypothetical protein
MARIRSHRSNVVIREGSASEASLRDVLSKPRVPRVRGTRAVTAMLPNGRITWLSIDPVPASAAQINHLRRAIERADVYHAAGLHDNAVAIRRLSKRVTTDLDRLGRRRYQRLGKLEARRLAGDEKNAQRFAVALERHKLAVRGKWADERAVVQRQARRQLWDSIVIASSAPLFAAYGQEGDPLAEHNLALTLSLGVWLLGDELSDLLAGPRPVRGTAARDLDLWSYVAPLGNMLTGWWLFAERQHQRFVTGIVDSFPEAVSQAAAVFNEIVTEPVEVLVPVDGESRYTYRAELDLAPSLAPGHVDDFRTFAPVPAVATLVTSAWDVALAQARWRMAEVTAEVELGILTITVTIAGPGFSLPVDVLLQPRVAWVVDTRDPAR